MITKYWKDFILVLIKLFLTLIEDGFRTTKASFRLAIGWDSLTIMVCNPVQFWRLLKYNLENGYESCVIALIQLFVRDKKV
jgi:hypothetical protein